MTRTASRTALIVDEDPTWRLLLSVALRTLGLEVRAVASAGEAMRLLEIVNPDLLVVDLHPPVPTGLGVIEKNAQSEAPLPVIALTTKWDRDLEDRAQELSLRYVFTKPIRQTELAAAVLEICQSLVR